MMGLFIQDHRTDEEKAYDYNEFLGTDLYKRVEAYSHHMDQIILEALFDGMEHSEERQRLEIQRQSWLQHDNEQMVLCDEEAARYEEHYGIGE